MRAITGNDLDGQFEVVIEHGHEGQTVISVSVARGTTIILLFIKSGLGLVPGV